MAELPIYMPQPVSSTAKVWAVVLGAGACIGGFFLLRSAYFKLRSNQEEKKAADIDSPAGYAQAIKMAFENDGYWGTDNDKLRQVFRDIPSQDFFKQVITSYAALYSNASLMRDLKSELQSSQYEEMMDIVAGKPVRAGDSTQTLQLQYLSWAKRLKAAFDKTYGPIPGTDDEAIKAVFLEIPSQAAYEKVAEVYRKTFGTNLNTDYKSEMQVWDTDYMYIIRSKPEN